MRNWNSFYCVGGVGLAKSDLLCISVSQGLPLKNESSRAKRAIFSHYGFVVQENILKLSLWIYALEKLKFSWIYCALGNWNIAVNSTVRWEIEIIAVNLLCAGKNWNFRCESTVLWETETSLWILLCSGKLKHRCESTVCWKNWNFRCESTVLWETETSLWILLCSGKLKLSLWIYCALKKKWQFSLWIYCALGNWNIAVNLLCPGKLKLSLWIYCALGNWNYRCESTVRWETEMIPANCA